jgi:hypothetical protein
MDGFFRKAGLVLGATLLATGWGLLKYADVQQKAVAENEAISLWAGERTKVSAWLEDGHRLPGQLIAMLGIVGMGAGAAMCALTLVAGRRYDPGP